jgi:hypothetical protein
MNVLVAIHTPLFQTFKHPTAALFVAAEARGCQVGTLERVSGLIVPFNGKI